ncbi:MAG: hypothetical protein M1822_005289 [Bathelium mastoideum]|nr:MAG: hypothetical protein M1822_005289 [Bathelium mastoideum]
MPSHHRKFRSPRKSQHQSSFFNLPPEVRNLIYRHALVHHKPIDLCPVSYTNDISKVKANSALASRLEKYEDDHRSELALYRARQASGLNSRWVSEPSQDPIVFRNQDDLSCLRGQMCVTLLSTCAQAYNEGSAYLWSENVFRFTDDARWRILYRFLLTIGPVARHRLTKVEVKAPFAEHMPNGRVAEMAKNHPKLHMAYVKKETKTGEGTAIDYTKAVMYLMYTENLWRLDVQLVVTAGQCVQRAFASEAIDEDTLHLYSFKKLMVVIESGASTTQIALDAMLRHGLDVICEAGVVLYEDDEPTRSTDVSSPLILRSTEMDELVGVPALFDTREEQQHARGGRVTKNAGLKKTTRLLRGFGGCRFVSSRDHWGEVVVEVKHKTRYRRMNALNW